MAYNNMLWMQYCMIMHVHVHMVICEHYVHACFSITLLLEWTQGGLKVDSITLLLEWTQGDALCTLFVVCTKHHNKYWTLDLVYTMHSYI